MPQHTDSKEVTRCLLEVSRGERSGEELLPLVYHELHGLARAMFARSTPGHTLQPTALVHEAYLKLVSPTAREWDSRAHFFAVGARAMRQILLNHVRDRNARKRGPDGQRVELDNVIGVEDQPALDLLTLDDALRELANRDQRQAQVVELRFFGGLTIEETAKVMGLSADTIKLEWRMAKAWLRVRLDHSA
jgi:RNA polymerase sigma-70 factor (ECF subfamily)